MNLNIEYVKLSSAKLNKDVRLALLSDLHGVMYGDGNKELSRVVEELTPDLILAAGDMISTKSREAFYGSIELLERLVQAAPCYFAYGNHEEYLRSRSRRLYNKYFSNLNRAGVHILSNTSEVLEAYNIELCGIRLPLTSYKKLAPYDYRGLHYGRIFKGLDDMRYNILLSHNPYAAKTGRLPFDLVLSGHMHGGGIRIPGLGALLGPNLLPFPRYTKGMYSLGGSTLVVSTGLGDHFPMLRINNPRSLYVIDIAIDKESINNE